MFRPRDLPLLVVFQAVAAHGSFTAAGRALGLGKSVVSDQLRALEARCGLRLLERTTRRVRLTQAGERLLPVARKVLDATREVTDLVELHRGTPVGTLRIATTHDLGRRFVAPVAGRLAALHPQLQFELVCDDALQDLVDGRFDLAIRLGRPRDSELGLRRLCTFEEPIVATPALASLWRDATRPSSLAGAPWVRHTLVAPGGPFTFEGPRGRVEEVTVSERARANTGDAVRALVRCGVGFGVLPDYQVIDDLRDGSLVRVCAAWRWKEVALFAALPTARRPPPRVELLLTALKEAVGRAGVGAIAPPV